MNETEPQIMVVGGKRGRRSGRNEGAWQVPVSTRLPPKSYDALVKEALRRDEPVASVVRQILLAQTFLSK